MKNGRMNLMFTVERQIEIDAGHRVPYHHSKCRFLHGHRWKIAAEVVSNLTVRPDPIRSDSGMVMDFGRIKEILIAEVHEKFDHKLILWDQDPLLEGSVPHLCTALDDVGIIEGLVQIPVIPTSECLAEYWAIRIAAKLDRRNYWLRALKVWETPNCVATFYTREHAQR
jgi:6-pyruvoyltetrahydropterin/6-carboxytetrahydropterin synthase